MRTITIAAALALMAASAPTYAELSYGGRYFDAPEGPVLRQGSPSYGYGWQYWYSGQYLAEGPVLRQGGLRPMTLTDFPSICARASTTLVTMTSCPP